MPFPASDGEQLQRREQQHLQVIDRLRLTDRRCDLLLLQDALGGLDADAQLVAQRPRLTSVNLQVDVHQSQITRQNSRRQFRRSWRRTKASHWSSGQES